jgi:beta-glucosidase
MGFDGIAVSDYCAIMNIHSVQKVSESFTEAGLRALSAGMDMELHFKKCFNEELMEWFDTGKADIDVLNKALLRILTTKFRMGLFENPYALSGEELVKASYSAKDEDITLKAARESLVLLKNDGILPVNKNIKKVAVIGCHIAYSYGYPVAGNDMTGHEKALEIAKEADLVILTLGGKHGTSSIASMGEGIDGTDINLPDCQEVFLEKLSKLSKAVVAVHFNGRPISSDAADMYANAILEAWNPAEKGAEAITDVLLGSYNPSGKLPLSVARTSGQIPVYYNHPNGSSYHQGESIGFSNYVDMSHTPRYFFGHGLSYTSFEYSNLRLSAAEIEPNSVISITFDIENTGKIQGTEVAQLYLKDLYASMTRPVMELAGFKRVDLKPGEKQTMTFQLEPSQLAFLDRELKWKIEAGDIEVQLGSSSNDIRLKDSFRITADLYIEGKNRKFYAKSSSSSDVLL